MTRTTDLPTALRADKAIPPSARTVTKRDGTSALFDRNKIVRAIALAIHDARSPDVPNPYRDDPLAQYGVRPEFYHSAAEIADDVEKMLNLWYRHGVQEVGSSNLPGPTNLANASWAGRSFAQPIRVKMVTEHQC